MRKVRVAPKGMGLNDFVAQEEGFFAAEGIEVEWDIKTFRGTQSSWKGLELPAAPAGPALHRGRRTEADPVRLRLGHDLQRQRRHGHASCRDCYGVSPWAIFVRPDSKIREPEDLKDVPVSVGMRAGSHFNVPYRLEKYLPLENIKTVNTGGFGARLQRAARRRGRGGEPAAAADRHGRAARPAQDHGGRVPHPVVGAETASARRRARPICAGSTAPRQALDADLEKYLPLWESSQSRPSSRTSTTGTSRKFSRGERFVYKPMPQRGVRRDARAGEALGPRPVPQGAEVREPGLSSADRASQNRVAMRRPMMWPFSLSPLIVVR